MTRHTTSRLKERRKSRETANAATESTPKGVRIGQAAKIIGVPAYVLRFWETQFPFLRPTYTPSHHRIYQPEDIEKLQLIKKLLYQDGFTIAGAKKRLKELGVIASDESSKPPLDEPARATESELLAKLNSLKEGLRELKQELLSLHELLEH